MKVAALCAGITGLALDTNPVTAKLRQLDRD